MDRRVLLNQPKIAYLLNIFPVLSETLIIIEIYQEATVVALPCIIVKSGDRDGIPVALFEALYMEIPVVSTSISGIPELITNEHNGLLVPPEDSTALATALARLLDNPDLRSRVGRAGKETILEKFNAS